MAYSIREMTIEDYDQAYNLWQKVEGMGLGEEDSRKSMEIYLKRNAGFCFVAVNNNIIIGTLLCGHEGRRGFLRHLAVAIEFRKQGIAREMIDKCLVALSNAGIIKCNTFVYDANKSGMAFWKRMGWYTLEDNYRTLQMPTRS